MSSKAKTALAIAAPAQPREKPRPTTPSEKPAPAMPCKTSTPTLPTVDIIAEKQIARIRGMLVDIYQVRAEFTCCRIICAASPLVLAYGFISRAKVLFLYIYIYIYIYIKIKKKRMPHPFAAYRNHAGMPGHVHIRGHGRQGGDAGAVC
jgi:hypothetical protein